MWDCVCQKRKLWLQEVLDSCRDCMSRYLSPEQDNGLESERNADFVLLRYCISLFCYFISADCGQQRASSKSV